MTQRKVALRYAREAEEEFHRFCREQGKKVFVYRFEDTSDIQGRNRGVFVHTAGKPCDFLITSAIEGITYFAEVKATASPEGFSKKLLRQSQKNFAHKIETAGGTYYIVIKNVLTGEFYRLHHKSLMLFERFVIPWDRLHKHLIPDLRGAAHALA